jgi:hypothetical protein
MSEFTVLEKDLAAAAGVSRSILQKKRAAELSDGVDYGRAGNSTAYSRCAALRVLDELGVDCPPDVLKRAVRPLSDDSEKKAVIAEVVKRFQPNTTVMECRIEKTAEHVLVRVHNNLMFEIGQSIPLKKTATSIYLLAAPQPRRRGQIPGFKEVA